MYLKLYLNSGPMKVGKLCGLQEGGGGGLKGVRQHIEGIREKHPAINMINIRQTMGLCKTKLSYFEIETNTVAAPEFFWGDREGKMRF